MNDRRSTTPIFQSLTRPILLLGGERENIILLACLSLSLCTVGRDLISVILAGLIWSIGIVVSKWTARVDPWATKILIRALLYSDFYAAREKLNTPGCVAKRGRRI